MYIGFMWGALREINHLEVSDMYAQIILECMFKKVWEDADCIHLPQD